MIAQLSKLLLKIVALVVITFLATSLRGDEQPPAGAVAGAPAAEKPIEASQINTKPESRPETTEPTPPPVKLKVDRGFSPYIDRSLLKKAMRSLDAAALTDVALQFLHGESVLMREHASFAADDVANLALQVATEKYDLVTLERLRTAFAAAGKIELVEKIEIAKGLGNESRAADPASLVSVTDMSVAAFTRYRNLLQYIEDKQLRGDRQALTELLEKLAKMKGFSEAELKTLISSAEEALQKTEMVDANLVSQLEQLSGESRGGDRYAAIAYSRSTGATGVYTYATSRAEAERGALRECGESDARIVRWVRNGHIAFALGENRAVGWAYSNTSKRDAETQATKACAQNGGYNIRIRWYLNSNIPF